MAKTRYAHVGTGMRSNMYRDAMSGNHKNHAELVAICDINPARMELYNKHLAEAGMPTVPAYAPEQFEQMVAETRPDRVIVTSGPDVTHSDYICRAMELGCDVVTEKPMTVDAASCRRILETRARTGREVQVSFNYRYSPPRSQIKEMILDDAIGDILSVDFTWPLDTRHGADYFRRWHRKRANSGSLLVHKATHHFDLINWWLDDRPEEVFCHGSLKYYTPATAERMGLSDHAERCRECPVKDACPFSMDLAENEWLKKMYLDPERHDGYYRDKCVFSEEIDIWDTMSVTVRYRRGALLTYQLHAYSPWEGYQIAFNGTKGRLEHHACENTYISGDGTVPGELERQNVSITYIPEFAKPRSIEPRTGAGGHGGGDPPLQADIFDPDVPTDRLRRKAYHTDGAYSILVGVAAYTSIDTGRPVKIAELLGDAPVE